MANLFGVDIRAILGNAFQGQLVPLQLIQETPAGRKPDNPTRVLEEGDPGYEGETQTYDAEGTYRALDARRRATLIDHSGEEIKILGASLPDDITPAHGNVIVYEGKRFKIKSVAYSSTRSSFRCEVVG